MKARFALVLGALGLAAVQLGLAQAGTLRVPGTVEAGSGFSIQSTGGGKATLYIVGPGQVLRRDVQMGGTAAFAPGEVHNAGHYLVFLAQGSSTENAALDVLPASQAANLSFLAKPSRLPVDLPYGISGVVYAFDAFQNLILAPIPITFQLSGIAGAGPIRTVTTRNGVAWTKMDSTTKEGSALFVARVGSVSGTRVIQQVPGDPCTLRMNAHPSSGGLLVLETDPVRDCSGNAVPDGTIVTFTETYDGSEATVDVPVKRGIARTEMSAHSGARISVATGVVMGNEIRWGKSNGSEKD